MAKCTLKNKGKLKFMIKISPLIYFFSIIIIECILFNIYREILLSLNLNCFKTYFVLLIFYFIILCCLNLFLLEIDFFKFVKNSFKIFYIIHSILLVIFIVILVSFLQNSSLTLIFFNKLFD